ncbi:hypothetical protein AC249_AIPGENE28626, partial [Exaiptasia diaphana]
MKPLMVVMLICVAVLPAIKSSNKTPVRYNNEAFDGHDVDMCGCFTSHQVIEQNCCQI